MTEINKLARQLAAEGMVLLKNENQVLPLKDKEKVAVFGRCQLEYYKSGTGSGGAVHVPYTSNVIDGLRQYPNIEINQDLLHTYESWLQDHPFDDGGGGWAAEPWFQEEMPLDDEMVKTAKASSDKALIVIGRTAGEDQDNKAVSGSYYLTDKEQDMIDMVTKHFEQVVVILNVSNILDMDWLNKSYDKPIQGLLYAWHGGMEGGNALADILTGQVNPSGKLTNTIAYKLEDYPSQMNFGSEIENFYEEDIYVGYRYFETFTPEKVMYPFGYGLSYTNFEISLDAFEAKEQNLTFKVAVQNTGHTVGKEVVQLYVKKPQGLLGQPKYALQGFVKTLTLEPGQKHVYEIQVPMNQLASYDDSGVTGHKSSYVLEAGHYDFFIGNSIRNLTLAKSHYMDFKVTERLQEALSPQKSFERVKAVENKDAYEISYEAVPLMSFDMEKRMTALEALKAPSKKFTLKDVEKENCSLDEFVGQLKPEELMTLVKGEGMCSPKVTAGTAAAFGGLSDALAAYDIPVCSCADGPSGIRMDSGKQASQVAIGTAQACSWNLPLIEAVYECIGKELCDHHIDALLGPGMNIHRDPLNGRNFEYFSEDPLMTGQVGLATTLGLKNGGSIATLKHFVANNQEKARHLADSIISERALREIYLKGFEMVVRSGHALSIMTSYNPVNGIYAASNYDLNTTILRDEWGYDGLVMTDWWAKTNHNVHGGTGDTKNKSYMVKAQNDIYMVVNHDNASNHDEDDLLSAYKDGSLSLGELQRSAKNILKVILKSHTYKSGLKHTNKRFFEAKQETLEHAIKTNEYIGSKEFNLYVEEDGVYDVIADSRYLSGPLSQSAYNVKINGEIAFMVQMHGSDEDYMERMTSEVQLEKGYYEIHFEFIRKGIEVRGVTVKKTK